MPRSGDAAEGGLSFPVLPIDLRGNPLSDPAFDVPIPVLQAHGLLVLFDEPKTPALPAVLVMAFARRLCGTLTTQP